MKKLINFIFICNITLLILAIIIVIGGIFTDYVLQCTSFGILCFIISILFLRYVYPDFLSEHRKSKRWFRKLSIEELQIVEDTKELIKKVDKKILISDFNVYSVRFLMHGWFDYDEKSKEVSIFIPFKFFSRFGGNDLCFLGTLHEVLHSQNLKNNMIIFDVKFLEGLNQLLTIWLIENYSKKYKIPKGKSFSIKISKRICLQI